LVHFFSETIHAILFTDGVKWHHVVSLFLELFVHSFPLLLKSSDKLLTLTIGHEELLAITLVLLFNLHFTNQVVLVLNLISDFG